MAFKLLFFKWKVRIYSLFAPIVVFVLKNKKKTRNSNFLYETRYFFMACLLVHSYYFSRNLKNKLEYVESDLFSSKSPDNITAARTHLFIPAFLFLVLVSIDHLWAVCYTFCMLVVRIVLASCHPKSHSYQT